MMLDAYYPGQPPVPTYAPAPEVVGSSLSFDTRDLLILFGVVMAANIASVIVVAAILSLRRPA